MVVIFGHTRRGVRRDCNTLFGGNAQKSARSGMREVVPRRAVTEEKREI